jgi:hypothetical protein
LSDLNYYLGGIGTMFQEIEDLAADTPEGEVGWSILMDVNRIPTKGLDWLAQFIGITVNHDDSDEGMRQQLRGHDRWGRGSPLSIIGPAYHWIPAGSQMYMQERSPNPWHVTFIFVTQPSTTLLYEDLFDLFTTYHKVRTSYATYNGIYLGERGDWEKVIETLEVNKPAGVQFTYIDTETTLYLAIYALLATYQVVYDTYLTYEAMYSAPFPDISLGIPAFQQLVSTRYYRNIWNQYETYANVWDTYVLY